MRMESEEMMRTRFMRREDVESEDTGHEVLVYLPGGDRTLYLNDSAAIVWRLCNGGLSGADIADLLEEAYPDAADTLRAEVAATLQDLLAQALIEIRD